MTSAGCLTNTCVPDEGGAFVVEFAHATALGLGSQRAQSPDRPGTARSRNAAALGAGTGQRAGGIACDPSGSPSRTRERGAASPGMGLRDLRRRRPPGGQQPRRQLRRYRRDYFGGNAGRHATGTALAGAGLTQRSRTPAPAAWPGRANGGAGAHGRRATCRTLARYSSGALAR